MKTSDLKLLYLSILFFCTSCATDQIIHGVPNLRQVEPGVWRGGQPNNEGWIYLKSLGIKRSIKLNTKEEGSDKEAISNGIEVIYLPIDYLHQVILKPNSRLVDKAVLAISNDGTYIHCLHGHDRTGLIVGIYQFKIKKWKKDKAESEMIEYGFHKELYGLWRYWEHLK